MLRPSSFLLAALLAAPASAADGGFALSELEGVWAVNCSEAPSPQNIHARWDRTEDGVVVYRYSYTERWPPAGLRVAAPTPTAEGWLRVSLLGGGTPVWTVTLAREGAKLRVMETVTGEGRTLIQGGTVLQTRTPTRPLERCESTAQTS